MREDLRTLTKDYDKSENDLKALQSVGQVIYRFAELAQIFQTSYSRLLEKY